MFKPKPDPQKLVEDLAGSVASMVEEIREQANADRSYFDDRLKTQTELIENLTISLKAVNAQTVEDARRIDQLESQLAGAEAKITHLDDDFEAVEQKLDEFLKAQDVALRSIPGEKPEPEPLNAMPGHVPWSARKRGREQASRSSTFIDKVKKGAAPTAPKTEAASE